jgi:hypothetical protein
MELSPEKKNDGNFASCAPRNDAVSVIFFSGDTPLPNKKINSFLKGLHVACDQFHNSHWKE